MTVFRIVRERYAFDLTGIGSALKGARWNSVGVELMYCAENRSLAMAEVAVHFSMATLPADFVIMGISIPTTTSIEKIEANDLPRDWNTFPFSPETQRIGDLFVARKRSCILKVPSVVTRGDHNFLLNPHHDEFRKIKISSVETFPFDRRLFE